MAHAIHKSNTRASSDLAVRREPHWGAPIAPGLFLGFRKLDDNGAGTWIARQRDEDKRQKYESLGNVGLVAYADAVTAARSWAKALENGVSNDAPETVGDVCRAYVKDRLREKGEANAEAAATMYRCHVYESGLADIKLAKLRTEQIKDWRADLVKKAVGREGFEPLADQSKNRVLSGLKAALNHAVASRWVDAGRSIEWSNVKDLVAHKRRELYLTLEQRRALVDAAPEHARPFLRALCVMPLRVGAVAHLTVANLSASHATLRVGKDKAGAGRTIPLAPVALALLREQAKGKTPAAPLVAFTDGSAWHSDRWKWVIQQAREAAGLPEETCAYSIRHSVITDMLVGGLDAMTVARLAGTSLDMIDKHYGHLLQQHAAEVMARLAL